jgi:glycosyltransferase involved in cell wall biosynthesis
MEREHRFAFAAAPRRVLAGWGKKGAIGIISPSYGTEKVSYGLSPPGFTYHQVSRIPVHRLERRGTFWRQTPIVLDHTAELIHSFNEIPIGIRPFVVSFEMELPRYLGYPSPWQVEVGYRLLASERCRGIYALSQAAADAMAQRLRQFGFAEVLAKLRVFRGTVSMDRAGDTPRDDVAKRPLRLLYVGRTAFRKGLIPVLDALEECARLHMPIEVTIVCGFGPTDYASKSYPVDCEQLRRRLRAIPGVRCHDSLPNREIRDLMRSHDVLLFPTLDESLGWVAVEAAMAGMVVVTTDIFALPELVRHGETGICIAIDKDPARRWVGLRQNGEEFNATVQRTFAKIRASVVDFLKTVCGDPVICTRMGTAARAHINSIYGHEVVRRQLAALYADALQHSSAPAAT